MPAANVRTYEKDMLSKVAGKQGVYNAIVIPAKKGPINEPVLVTNEANLLNRFTPNGTIKIGYNMAYYSALTVLQQTNSLWVIRAANGALNGGAFVNQAGTSGITFKQINETSPELKEIKFSVSNIIDGLNTVTVSNLVGGTASELNGREINILGVGAVTYTVTNVVGSVLTLNAPINATVSFVGTGAATVAQSSDFISFNADFGAGGDSTSIEATNLSSGTTSDLNNRVISFVADGVRFTRTVVAVSGSTLTVETVTPTITNQNGSGYRGTQALSANVSGIAEGSSDITLSGILPTYLSIDDFNGKNIQIVANMTDSSTLVISSVGNGATGSEITLDAVVNNPSLPDTASGEAPYAEATATGFLDASTIAQPLGNLVTFNPASFYSVMSLHSINEGEWSKDIRVEILTVGEKTPGTFRINVYPNSSNLVRPVETFVCSRDPEAKDGFGRNIFVETVLQSSNYINAVNNPVIEKSVLPRETVTRDSLGNITSKYPIKFVGGDDGDAVTDSQMIVCAELLNNKNNYPLTVFLDGGWTSPAYQRKLAEICEMRDDSFAVLSVPFETEVNPITYIKDIVDYRNIELNLNSSFAGLYSSHLKITDKYNNREIFISPDGFAAAAINLSASEYEIWFPPAGFKRGRLIVNDVHVKFTDGDLDFLADNGINQIRFAPGKGVAIWGQMTLAIVPSSFDRINIRMLLNVIKPDITAFLEKYLFELNTQEVRNSIRLVINSYLLDIHTRNGIADFKVVCDDSNNTATNEANNTLNVDVYIRPIYSIEYINFTTIISNNIVSFSI